MKSKFPPKCFGYALKVTLGCLLFGLSLGCSATPVKPSGYQAEFPHSRLIVQQSASEALSVFGFELEREESGYLEGHHPRTLGVFCITAGETAGVWLEETGPSQTRVSVHTAMPFLEIWCERDWTHSILGEMKKLLNLKEGGTVH